MKRKMPILIAFICFLLPFVLYFAAFHGPLSNDDQNWANLASFVGGVIGPIFAFASFFMVLLVYYQSQEEKNTAKTEDRFFKYIGLLNDCHMNIQTTLPGTSEIVRGEQLIGLFNAESFQIKIEDAG